MWSLTKLMRISAYLQCSRAAGSLSVTACDSVGCMGLYGPAWGCMGTIIPSVPIGGHMQGII